MSSSLTGRLRAYFEVFMLLAIAWVLLPITIASHPLMLITAPSTFRAKWFEKLWNVIGSSRAAKPQQSADIEEIMSRAHGVVLEIGPGTGEQSHHFKPEKIEKVYGVEPNQFMHGKLLEKAKAAGLEGRYIPVLAGGEPDSLIPALRRYGLVPGSSTTLPEEGIFDSIIAIKVLCSIPREQTAASVAVYHRLLKPHGELLFYEHVENRSDAITRKIVSTFGFIWPWFTGGCHLDSKFDQVVLSTSGWAERRVQTTNEFQGYEIIRYVKGVCVKE